MQHVDRASCGTCFNKNIFCPAQVITICLKHAERNFIYNFEKKKNELKADLNKKILTILVLHVLDPLIFINDKSYNKYFGTMDKKNFSREFNGKSP